MDLVTKDFPVTSGEATSEHPHGTFEVILSAPTLDRDGEVVDSKAFEPLPTHITFDTDHSMTVDSVVGSGTPYYAEDGTLRVKGGYCSDERSQTVRQKVADGHIRTTSVTFMAAKREKDAKGVPHVIEAELLNGTFTPVPSNRESVVLSAKSIVAKEGRRNSSSDAEHIQAAHDAMAALGASCGAGKNLREAEGKALAGSVEALQERVLDALQDAFCDPSQDPQTWVWLRGVLPTYCVYDLSTGGVCETYRIDYTDDGAVTTLAGDPALVDVMETVVPDADADREPVAVPKSTDTATTDATALAAAAVAAKSADDEAARKALEGVFENAARFAFGN